MASTTTEKTRAILSSGPEDISVYTPGSNWTHTTVSVPTSPGAGEILVQMAATGICHTDLTITAPPYFTSPRIVGHKGSEYVRAIGNGVKKDVKVGDPVLLSFDHCGSCEPCTDKPSGVLHLLCVP